MPSIRVGTSGWSYKDWNGVFYPPGTSAGDFLTWYADRFDIVEVDSTYYRIPSPSVVAGWNAKTPEDFRFAVKAPSVITHEKTLVNCEAERDLFLAALEPLGEKLHSVLLQFGYFNKKTFAEPGPFLQRLDGFLRSFPTPRQLAVEIRNKHWLGREFFDVLRAHGASYALTEHAWMPPVERVFADHDCTTGDFVYLRLIGDRKGIEEVTTTWDKVVVDRGERIRDIVSALTAVMPKADIVTFINNHYAGHAPASVQDFLDAMSTTSSRTHD